MYDDYQSNQQPMGDETLLSKNAPKQPQQQTQPQPDTGDDLNKTVMSKPKVNNQRPMGSALPPQKKGFNKLLLLIPVVLVFLILLGVGAYFGIKAYLTPGETGSTETTEIVEPEEGQQGNGTVGQQGDITPAEALDLLAGLDLTLARIQEVEANVIHNGTPDEENLLNRRIIALKHLYTTEFLQPDHSVQKLRNSYMLYSEDFSQQQREVFKWFFAMSTAKKEKYEYLNGSVENFNDFREKMEASVSH